MRRILFRILNTLSITLLIFSAAACVYSMFRGSMIVRTRYGTMQSAVGVGVADGRLLISVLVERSCRSSGDSPIAVVWDTGPVDLESFTVAESSMTSVRAPGIMISRMGWEPTSMLNVTYVVIHFGWPILLFSILPTYWLLTRHRDPRRRAKLGLCIKCGYDLRGSAGTCPECGTPASVQASAPIASPTASHERSSACDD